MFPKAGVNCLPIFSSKHQSQGQRISKTVDCRTVWKTKSRFGFWFLSNWTIQYFLFRLVAFPKHLRANRIFKANSQISCPWELQSTSEVETCAAKVESQHIKFNKT